MNGHRTPLWYLVRDQHGWRASYFDAHGELQTTPDYRDTWQEAAADAKAVLAARRAADLAETARGI